MDKRLVDIIESEDIKNPLKDEQISKILGISRTKVNELRRKNDIPSYQVRRDKLLVEKIKEIIVGDFEISIRQLVVMLNKSGFEISAYGLNKYREIIEKIRTEARSLKPASADCEKAFDSIIGYSKSLKPAIKKGKAAVLYPPNGLHALLVGETGTGKSSIVEALYSFAKCFKKDENMPFVLFNCADYSENPQLLVSELFGHAKGSFTGADSDKVGLVENADGGILFLDEIHRLPPKGQEILFSIIDRGVFSRLGETRKGRKADLMIVGATTENVESSLLMTFRRRIPFLIQIPPLSRRPVLERFEIIQLFFSQESARINRNFQIPRQIIKALIFYDCPGNIGQLKSDIQVACAQAYIDSMENDSYDIVVKMANIPGHIKEQLHEIDDKVSRQMQMIISDIFVSSSKSSSVNIEDCIFKENIYRIFEEFEEEKGMDVECREYACSTKDIFVDIKDKVNAYLLDMENRYSSISNENLRSIVGDRIVDLVKKTLSDVASGIEDRNIATVIALHMSIAIERMNKNRPISNCFESAIREGIKAYYETARRFIERFSSEEGTLFPKAEWTYIALILEYFSRKSNSRPDQNVGILVATYGSVSSVMVQTAREFLGVEYGSHIQLEFGEDSTSAISKIKSAVELVDNGKGVVVLVDMEPLLSYCDIVASEHENSARVIPRVDTPMVIEAIHKALIPSSTVDEIYNSILKVEKSIPYKLLNRDDIESIGSLVLE